MEAFSRIGTKSGKNKTQGLKWKLHENVGTKSDFITNNYYIKYYDLIIYTMINNMHEIILKSINYQELFYQEKKEKEKKKNYNYYIPIIKRSWSYRKMIDY